MRKGRLEEAEEWLQMTGIDIYADNAKEIKELMEEFQNIIKE